MNSIIAWIKGWFVKTETALLADMHAAINTIEDRADLLEGAASRGVAAELERFASRANEAASWLRALA